jgi:hypothetical protein
MRQQDGQDVAGDDARGFRVPDRCGALVVFADVISIKTSCVERCDRRGGSNRRPT